MTINSEVRAERVIRVDMELIRLQYVTNFEPLYRIRSVRREWNECTKAKGMIISHVEVSRLLSGNGREGAYTVSTFPRREKSSK